VSAVLDAGGTASLAPPPRTNFGQRLSLGTPFRYLAALVVLALTLVPLLFVILGGFRSNAQLTAAPTGLPHPWVWSNYASIVSSLSFWQALGTSALIGTVTTALTLGLGSMVAFALSRYEFRWRHALFLLFAVGLLFPPNAAALPLYLLLKQLTLLDNQLGLTLPEAAFSLPFTIVILQPFMRAIPAELEDAAVVDGASKLKFFVQVLLPLCRPALITVGLLAFIQSWNAYLLPLLVFSTPSHFPLPLGVATFQSQFSQNTASIFAYDALSMVPALAFFVFAQRRLIGGLTGAVKG
jgi:raffinose/stachyose/melibiose transport system permease protein